MILTSDSLRDMLPHLNEVDVEFLGFSGKLESIEHKGDGEYAVAIKLMDADFVPHIWEIKEFQIIIKGYDSLIASTLGAKISHGFAGGQLLELTVRKITGDRDEI